MDMEKPNRRMDIVRNNKFQDVRNRAEELKLLASKMSSGQEVDFLQGIERVVSELMQKARNGARKVEAISKKVSARKLHLWDRKISEFGRLVGKMG